MIYVDDFAGKVKGYVFYHMMSDTDGEEIHDFAKDIGVQRKWFQNDHYDVTDVTRGLAIGLGAIPITLREMHKIRRAKRQRHKYNKANAGDD